MKWSADRAFQHWCAISSSAQCKAAKKVPWSSKAQAEGPLQVHKQDVQGVERGAACCMLASKSGLSQVLPDSPECHHWTPVTPVDLAPQGAVSAACCMHAPHLNSCRSPPESHQHQVHSTAPLPPPQGPWALVGGGAEGGGGSEGSLALPDQQRPHLLPREVCAAYEGAWQAPAPHPPLQAPPLAGKPCWGKKKR